MSQRGKKRARLEEDFGDDDHEAPPSSSGTEAIIQSALEVEEQLKAIKQGQVKKKKGVAVEEVEAAEEDGVVMPSRIEQTRQLRRKARATADDTELLPDNEVAKVEEDLLMPEDDGIQLEPFNLVQERATGRFDESGHYIEDRAKGDVTDAWLSSAEAAEVSGAVKLRALERQRAMEAADAAPVMSTVQMAHLKAAIAEVLHPGETVTRGLQRLGAAAGSSRRPGIRPSSKKPPGKGGAAPAPAATPQEQAAAKADFNRLTEAASQLMDSGELDVYSLKQEDFVRVSSLFARKPGSDAADKDDADDGEDMFADSDTEAEKSAAASKSAGIVPAGKDGGGAAAAAAAPPSGDASTADTDNPAVPPGYVHDPDSGYFYSEESRLYYDTTSGAYFSMDDGTWYSWDGSSFVPWPNGDDGAADKK